MDITSIPGIKSAHYFPIIGTLHIELPLTSGQQDNNPTYFSFKEGIISVPYQPQKQASCNVLVCDAFTSPSVQDHLNVGTGTRAEVKYDMVTYYGMILKGKNYQYIPCTVLETCRR